MLISQRTTLLPKDFATIANQNFPLPTTSVTTIMSQPPTDIRAIRDQGILQITWGEEKNDLSFVNLRGQCECAHCVNEWTGERILDPASVPADITIEKMEQVGSYAIRITWSDGHNSGLYTWQRLKEICNQA